MQNNKMLNFINLFNNSIDETWMVENLNSLFVYRPDVRRVKARIENLINFNKDLDDYLI